MRQWNWGSTADWVTGIVTAVAVWIAALAFRHDRAQHRKSQARLLRIQTRFNRDDDPWTHSVMLDNRSESEFVDVCVIYDVTPEKMLAGRRSWQGVMKGFRREIRANVRARVIGAWHGARLYWEVHRRTPHYAIESVGTISPADGFELDLPIEEGVKLLVVAFEDSLGQSWAWDIKKKRMLSRRLRVRLRIHTSKLFESDSTLAAGSLPVR